MRCWGAATLDEARARLAEHPDCALALVQWAGVDDGATTAGEPMTAVLRGSGCKVLLFGCDAAASTGSSADAFELEGPLLVARVLERAQGLAAGRRGPKARAVEPSVAEPHVMLPAAA